MSYHNRKLAQIKDNLSQKSFPPISEDGNWKNKINCYGYALNIDIQDPKQEILIPGCISSQNTDKFIFSPITLLENVKADLNFLGFSWRKDDKFLENGEYRIAIYYCPRYHDYPIGFHFLRQNQDGTWSGKKGWDKEVEKFEKTDIPPNLEKHNCYLYTVLILKK